MMEVIMKKLLLFLLALSGIQNGSAMHMVTVTLPPLILSVFYDQLNLIEEIIQHPQANVNMPDMSGKTALWHAANIGNHNALAILLSSPRVNKEFSIANGATALYTASANGHSKCVDLLIKAGANKEAAITTGEDQGTTALIAAAANDHSDCLSLLINAGANKEAVLLNGEDQGITALIIAASNNHLDCLRLLIEAGANKEAFLTYGDNCGQTALMMASEKGHAECLEILIKAGAQVDVALGGGNFQGKTALIAATMADTDNAECVKLLLEAGADKEATFSDDGARGLTAISFAVANGHIGCLKLLIDAHADLEAAPAASNNDETPLMVAAFCGHIDCVRLLIKAGAKKESGNSTVIKRAEDGKHFLLARFLDEEKDHMHVLEDTSGVCPICQEEYQEDDLVIKFACGCKNLMIHSQCFSAAKGSLQKCPLCRYDLPSLDYEQNSLNIIAFPQIDGICGQKRKLDEVTDQASDPKIKKF